MQALAVGLVDERGDSDLTLDLAIGRIKLTVLRLIHIVAGGFWAGAGIMMGWFVAPAARSVGPGAGPFMQALLKRKVPMILITAGLVTVGAGLWMWAIRRPTMSRWQDWALAAGAVSAIVAVTLGIGWQRPTGAKVMALGTQIANAGSPPTPEQGAEMGRLQGKMARYGSTIAYLFVISLAGMALGGG